MFYKLFCASVMLAVAIGIASADTIKGAKITKIEGNKITVDIKGKEKGKFDTKEFTAAEKIKVCIVSKDKDKKETKEECAEGLKAEILKTLPVTATLEVEGTTVSAIAISKKK